MTSIILGKAYTFRLFCTVEIASKEFSKCLHSKSRYAIPKPRIVKGRKGKKSLVASEDDLVLYKSRDQFPKSAIKEKQQMQKRFMGRISRLVERKDIKKAMATLTEMKTFDVLPNAKLYNLLISGLSRTGETEQALIYFEEMRSKEVKPTTRTFCSLFHAISKAGRSDKYLAKLREILDIFRNSENCRHAEDCLYVYNAAMKAFVFCGDSSAAFEMYDDMISLDIKVDDITTASLLLACQQDKEHGMRNAVTALTEVKQRCSINFSEVEVLNNVLLVCRDCKDKEYHADLLQLIDPNYKCREGTSEVSMYLQIGKNVKCDFDLRTHQLLLYMVKSVADIKNIRCSLEEHGLVMDKHFLVTMITKYMYLTEPKVSADLIHEYVKQHDIDEPDEVIKPVLKSFNDQRKRYKLSKALEPLGYKLNAKYVEVILQGMKTNKKQAVVEKLVKDAEERNILPTAETIALVQGYTNELLKRQKIDQHYLYLSSWLAKYDTENEIVSRVYDEKYNHL